MSTGAVVLLLPCVARFLVVFIAPSAVLAVVFSWLLFDCTVEEEDEDELGGRSEVVVAAASASVGWRGCCASNSMTADGPSGTMPLEEDDVDAMRREGSLGSSLSSLK